MRLLLVLVAALMLAQAWWAPPTLAARLSERRMSNDSTRRAKFKCLRSELSHDGVPLVACVRRSWDASCFIDRPRRQTGHCTASYLLFRSFMEDYLFCQANIEYEVRGNAQRKVGSYVWVCRVQEIPA